MESGGQAAHPRQPRTGYAALVDAIGGVPHKPKVLVCASAIGYYGDRGDEVLRESSAPGSGFLADVAAAGRRKPIAPPNSDCAW